MHLDHNKENIEFHLATSKEASVLVEFHNSYYGTTRKPTDWLWEYRGCYPDKSILCFATENGKIIATQGMLPVYMDIGSKRVLSGKSESTLLLPAYRGTTLMPELYEYATNICIEKGMDFLWGFTPAVKAFKKYGFQIYPSIKTLVRPGNLWAGLRLRLRNKLPFWHKAGSIGKLFLRYLTTTADLVVENCNENDGYVSIRQSTGLDSIHRLFYRLMSQHKNSICISYNEKYLNWRVRQHPFIHYTEYQAFKRNTLKAYAIVAIFNGIVTISDLTSEDEKATSILLHTILKDFNKNTVEFHFMLNTRDVLLQGMMEQFFINGFSASGETNLVVRDLKNGINEEINNISNWHINGLWSEGYSM